MGKDLNNTERAQSLINARLACERLNTYKFSTDESMRYQREMHPNAGFFHYTLNEIIGHLIAGFEILDAKEQAQIRAGKLGGPHGAPHGSKGGWKKGRPRGTTKEKK